MILHFGYLSRCLGISWYLLFLRGRQGLLSCTGLATNQRTSASVHNPLRPTRACPEIHYLTFLTFPPRLIFLLRHSFVFEPRCAIGCRWPTTIVQVGGGGFGSSTTILLTTLFKVRKNCRIQILISELSWLTHEVEFVLVDLCRSR